MTREASQRPTGTRGGQLGSEAPQGAGTREADIWISGHLRSMIQMRQAMNGVPEGYNYLCMEDFVIDRGQFMVPNYLTDDELELVTNSVERAASYFNCSCYTKECYYNAQVLAMINPEFVYHEGYANAITPMLHAWVTLNGKVIDVTWRNSGATPLGERTSIPLGEDGDDLDERRLGGFGERVTYCGVAFTSEQLLEHIDLDHGGPMIDRWEDGWPVLKMERISPLPEKKD